MGMNAAPQATEIRSVWHRRSSPSQPCPSGLWRYLALSAIGHAAARETLVTATYHIAPIWTALFRSMLTSSSELRWVHNGLGIGRDARSAYSSLLGRYVARAYLTDNEGIRVLVPLDTAKLSVQQAGYIVTKTSPGFEADWVGLDDSRLVIVEAKGSFDSTNRPWHGQWPSQPREFRTAIAQAHRTNISVRSTGIHLPARRWAIASRWGTEDNKCEPTLLAWVSDDQTLHPEDYQALMRIFCSIDRDLFLFTPFFFTPFEGTWSSATILVDGLEVGPGFAMIVGPSGLHPLRSNDDFRYLDIYRELNVSFAIASLSVRYMAMIGDGIWPEQDTITDAYIASRNGLTVVWPNARNGLTVVWPNATLTDIRLMTSNE